MLSEGVRLFQKIIVGVFDNQEQVDLERSKNAQVHPLAKHVTDIMDEKVDNVPEGFDGTFILEESYYHHVNKPYEIKPLLFKITPNGPYDIFLESLMVPERLDKKEVINANAELRFDYFELKANAAFGKAHYHNMGDYFLVKHFADFGHGITFDFQEKLTTDTLQVMELWMKNGESITPYQEPILYKRQ